MKMNDPRVSIAHVGSSKGEINASKYSDSTSSASVGQDWPGRLRRFFHPRSSKQQDTDRCIRDSTEPAAFEVEISVEDIDRGGCCMVKVDAQHVKTRGGARARHLRSDVNISSRLCAYRYRPHEIMLHDFMKSCFQMRYPRFPPPTVYSSRLVARLAVFGVLTQTSVVPATSAATSSIPPATIARPLVS